MGEGFLFLTLYDSWFEAVLCVCRDFLWLQIWSGENLLITHFAAVAGSSGGVNRIHISSEILVRTPRELLAASTLYTLQPRSLSYY